MPSTADNLRFLQSSLKTWSQDHQGTVEIAADIVHLFALLSIKPGGFRVGIKAKGEDKRGEHEELGFVDRRYWICLSFGQSMQLSKGSAMVKGPAGGEAWGDIIDSCRDWLRGLQFDPTMTEAGPDYKGWHELIEIHPDFLVDGVYFEITIGQMLGPPADTGLVQQIVMDTQ